MTAQHRSLLRATFRSSRSVRAVLINPPDPSSSDNLRLVPPLGLGYVAAVAHREGHRVDVLDLALQLEPAEEFLDRVVPSDCEVIGLSSYSDTIYDTVRLAERLRSLRPRARIVLGGYHASLVPVECMQDFTCLDFVIRNEGEQAFADLLAAASLGYEEASLSTINNLTWRTSSGKLVSNITSGSITRLDDLPVPVLPTYHPPYMVLRDARRGSSRRIHSIVGSRGCPKRCTFCSIVILNPQWRHRSTSSIVDELRHERNGERGGHVAFQDANLFVSPKYVREVADAIYEFDPTATWSGTATPDHVVRFEDTIRRVGSMNCTYIEVGIEAGNNSSLARFGKGNTVELNERAISVLCDAGIELGLDFIMFEPCMSLADLVENFEFLRRNELFGRWPAACLFQELRAYPGTVMRQTAERVSRRQFEPHEVPDIAFEDADVRRVFETITVFRDEVQGTVDTLLKVLLPTIDRALFSGNRLPDEALRRCQRATEVCTRLQHVPFRAFADIVADDHIGPSDMGALGRKLGVRPLVDDGQQLLAQIARDVASLGIVDGDLEITFAARG